MVTSMLLSYNEIMNGTGCPFNLSKENIPLEGRIYAVVRSYEILCLEQIPEDTVRMLTSWSTFGAFDRDILKIFLENITRSPLRLLPRLTDRLPSVSAYRKNQYRAFVQKCDAITGLSTEIQNAYFHLRKASEDDLETQNVMSMKTNKLQLQLLQIADIRKIILVTRHGQTVSDTPD